MQKRITLARQFSSISRSTPFPYRISSHLSSFPFHDDDSTAAALAASFNNEVLWLRVLALSSPTRALPLTTTHRYSISLVPVIAASGQQCQFAQRKPRAAEHQLDQPHGRTGLTVTHRSGRTHQLRGRLCNSDSLWTTLHRQTARSDSHEGKAWDG